MPRKLTAKQKTRMMTYPDVGSTYRPIFPITYHGRTGRPLVHYAPKGRAYIMVRKEGGGTKRLYEGSEYWETKGVYNKLRLF